MFESNPNLVQPLPRSLSHLSPPPVPLVLIHDGGGTIYSYYCLGGLAREVHGIYNPHYGTTEVFAGGIPEMAGHYASLIRSTFPAGGDIILGGWSLGGLLSLQVARILAEEDENNYNNNNNNSNKKPGKKEGHTLNVLGIVMIDSVYPRAPSFQRLGSRVVQHVVEWGESTRRETREAVQRCFDEAYRMVREWELPRWEDAQEQDGTYEPGSAPRREIAPPPVWLLRAREPVPVLEEGVSRVDMYRRDRKLGWDQYREGLVVSVEDVPGHHYNLFSFEHVDEVTEVLKRVCTEVENRGRRKDGAREVQGRG